MSNGSAQADGAIATYRVLRELGERSQPSYAALRGDGSLVVLHRFARGAGHGNSDGAGERELVSDEQMALLLRDARCLAKNWHPNIARVRHVDLATDVLHVATELVDGVTFDELLAIASTRRAHPDEPALSHAIVARIFLDVLAGLSALHSLRDGIKAPLDAFHGELCPANVVVGKDGVARIINVFRPRPVTIRATSEALGHASPETLAGEVEQDARADIHSVGVMLWEALAERRLYDETSPARIAQRQREEEIAPPNARLADVAMRALAFDPALRFRTAQEMAASIRAHAGTVASGSTVAQLVTDFAGDRIRSRRASLDPQSSGQRPVSAGLREPSSGTPPRMPGKATVSSLPPPDEDDDGLPGPRESTPDDEYLARLGTDLRGPRSSSTVLDELGASGGDDDDVGDALATAREIVLSNRAITPAPEPRSVSPELPALTPASAPRRAPSTRTPFVVDVLPTSLEPTSDVDDTPRRSPPRVALAIAAAVVLAGAALLALFALRPAPVAPTAAARAPDPPSTVIVAPPPVVDPLPHPSTSASTSAAPPPRSSASATAARAPAPPRKKSP